MTTKIDLRSAQAEIKAENQKLLDAGLTLPIVEGGKIVFVSSKNAHTKAQSGKAA